MIGERDHAKSTKERSRVNRGRLIATVWHMEYQRMFCCDRMLKVRMQLRTRAQSTYKRTFLYCHHNCY